MWCGLCVKKETPKCFKKLKFVKKMSPACSKFVLDTRKIPAKVLHEAISVSAWPKTQLMVLAALIDSGLRLRGQQLNIGSTVDYCLKDPEQKGKMEKVYLISSPKRDEFAYGIVFRDKPKRNTVISVTLPKEKFIKARDKKLKELWPQIEYVCMLCNAKKKKKILVTMFKKIPKYYIQKMLVLNKIKIKVKGRKSIDVINELSRLL